MLPDRRYVVKRQTKVKSAEKASNACEWPEADANDRARYSGY
jgi:hypothetical protein